MQRHQAQPAKSVQQNTSWHSYKTSTKPPIPRTQGAFKAAVGLVDPPPLPPPWLAVAGQKRLGGGMSKIKGNEAKTATLGVPRGASHPLLT